ncbi:hypothetical protein CHISP_0277 [Chitinispirillum alkaliphilum]|nr:hypothetical protein CHISP_0277 [Chitinispirillum alkaliphilum]
MFAIYINQRESAKLENPESYNIVKLYYKLPFMSFGNYFQKQ